MANPLSITLGGITYDFADVTAIKTLTHTSAGSETSSLEYNGTDYQVPASKKFVALAVYGLATTAKSITLYSGGTVNSTSGATNVLQIIRVGRDTTIAASPVQIPTYIEFAAAQYVTCVFSGADTSLMVVGVEIPSASNPLFVSSGGIKYNFADITAIKTLSFGVAATTGTFTLHDTGNVNYQVPTGKKLDVLCMTASSDVTATYTFYEANTADTADGTQKTGLFYSLVGHPYTVPVFFSLAASKYPNITFAGTGSANGAIIMLGVESTA